MRTQILGSTLLRWGEGVGVLDRLEALWFGMEFPGIWMKEKVWPAREAELRLGSVS